LIEKKIYVCRERPPAAAAHDAVPDAGADLQGMPVMARHTLGSSRHLYIIEIFLSKKKERKQSHSVCLPHADADSRNNSGGLNLESRTRNCIYTWSNRRRSRVIYHPGDSCMFVCASAARPRRHNGRRRLCPLWIVATTGL
jgi:hypothetical protein